EPPQRLAPPAPDAGATPAGMSLARGHAGGPGGLVQKAGNGEGRKKDPAAAASFYPTPVLPALRPDARPALAPALQTHVRRAPFGWQTAGEGTAGVETQVPFDWRQVQVRPDEVAVHHLGPHYYVSERSHPILDCGPREDEARQVLQVIRQHHFDNFCRIGPDDQHAMTFFVREH